MHDGYMGRKRRLHAAVASEEYLAAVGESGLPLPPPPPSLFADAASTSADGLHGGGGGGQMAHLEAAPTGSVTIDMGGAQYHQLALAEQDVCGHCGSVPSLNGTIFLAKMSILGLGVGGHDSASSSRLLAVM